MDAFSIIQLLAWVVVAAVAFLFAATGGFDLGAGMLTPFLGKTDAERRVIVNTVGPTWDGNQVWLIIAGGAIFAIWPRVYAASFSGFYFAILVVLWGLFWRPVAFEYRSKLPSQRWRTFWDWALCIGSLLPALIMGVGIGNVFLGVPFQFDPFSLRFFYGHTMSDSSGLIDLLGLLRPFALLIGVMSVVMMLMHGASYLTVRTRGIVHRRSQKCLTLMASLLIILFAVAGIWLAVGVTGYHYHAQPHAMLHPLNNQVTQSVGGWMGNYAHHPWMVVAPIVGFLGLFALLFFNAKQRHVAAFVSSTVAVLGVVFTGALSLFPFIMPSSLKPAQSLLVWNASSSEVSLIDILVVAVIALPVIFFYTNFVYRKLWQRGQKMDEAAVKKDEHVLY